MKEYEEEFMCWMIFQQAMPQIERTKEWMLEEAEKKASQRQSISSSTACVSRRPPGSWKQFSCLGEEL